MGDDQETITVAELSDGPPMGDQPDESVDLPVVEILTGRGFITGKSGSGKSNTASVVAEKLLDAGFGILIVDIDGEYYGLKEEYEILHVGADDECDIQVTTEHAGKIASLALEQNVPIILDVSSFLDEDEAESLLTEVSKQLFAKEKKLKQPFLMLVEEVHEWIPEKGSVSECGKMLIKIGKRGRKHGLGMVGISQRPADVKKDFITQCDWLVWHRLTWNNDTNVVSRIIDSEYADAVENLNDGEAFMMTDWSETVRRVQFHRKQTFDAGATPGLEDVDRPDLKSVSSDLVSELEEISDEKEQTESRIQELREELDQKNSRIAELETELQDARDMSRMADQFVEALLDTVQGPNPGRTEQERMREYHRRQNDDDYDSDAVMSADASTTAQSPDDGTSASVAEETTDATTNAGTETATETTTDAADAEQAATDATAERATADDARTDATGSETATTDETSETARASETAETAATEEASEPSGEPSGAVIDSSVAAGEAASTNGTAAKTNGSSGDVSTMGLNEGVVLSDEDDADDDPYPPEQRWPGEIPSDCHDVVVELQTALEAMEPKTLGMLRYYRKEGPATVLDAHFAGGGDGDRTNAYAHNRTLRTNGLIEHVGRGHYDYSIRSLIEEEYDGRLDDDELDAVVDAVEEAFGS